LGGQEPITPTAALVNRVVPLTHTIHPTDDHKKAAMDRLKAYNATQAAAIDEAAKKPLAP
jgi:hypothetical protein